MSEKKVFTTGAVAKLFGININTVIKWFDEGKIEGFRLPMSNDRRIPIGALRTFMSSNSIPMDLLEENGPMRRKHTRVGCSESIKFTVTNGSAYGPYEGKLADISHGGAKIKASGKDALSIPFESFRLGMEINDGPLSSTNLEGKIVHLKPEESQLSIGVQFTDIDHSNQSKLSNFLEDKLG